jgi:choline dehydrogenase-like flavoprotein
MDNYMRFGLRQDAFKGSLRSIFKDRPTLTIRKFSFVTKVLIDTSNGDTKAYGVRYERHGKMFEVRARKEVILSAGTLHTAKLLMLSGIGPHEHLHEMGVRLKK